MLSQQFMLVRADESRFTDAKSLGAGDKFLIGAQSGTTNFFTSAFDIFAAVTDTNVQETALFKHGNKAALPVLATFTPTGDTCAAATAGQVDIDVAFMNVTTDLTTIP